MGICTDRSSIDLNEHSSLHCSALAHHQISTGFKHKIKFIVPSVTSGHLFFMQGKLSSERTSGVFPQLCIQRKNLPIAWFFQILRVIFQNKGILGFSFWGNLLFWTINLVSVNDFLFKSPVPRYHHPLFHFFFHWLSFPTVLCQQTSEKEKSKIMSTDPDRLASWQSRHFNLGEKGKDYPSDWIIPSRASSVG